MALQVKEPSMVLVDGRKMAYDEVSPPNPRGNVLLLTGLGSKRLGWYKQLDEFGKYYRTIALDHRDTGDSDYVSEPYAIKDQADDAAKVLKALGISKTHVIGISMGGFIALELTLRHPELVDKLVLTATSAGGPTHVAAGPQMQAQLIARNANSDLGEVARQTYTMITAPGFPASHPAEMERIADTARYKPQQVAGYFRQLQACGAHNAADRLSQIAVPTLVVHGESDPLVPPQNGQHLAHNIKGAKLIMYPNTGHIPIIEQAENYNRDVLAFLDS